MKICVFGTGAIGSHLAGRLAKGGAELSIVARGAQLAAIQKKGITVRAPDGELHCMPRASADPAALGPQDAVLVTTKQTALPSVAASIAPLLGPETSVTFVVNGIPWWYYDSEGGPNQGTRLPQVDPGDAMRQAVGIERTIGGVVWSACTVTEPGVVEVRSPTSRLILGEPDGTVSARAEAIAGILKAGGLGAKAVPDIRTELWAKLIGNLSQGPLCVLSRQDMRTTLAEPAIRAAALRSLEESIAIAHGLGIPLQINAQDRFARSVDTAHKPSILQDLEAGRPMEVAAIFDLPLLLARQAGVETPTLDLCVALARQTAQAAGLYQG